MCLAYLCVPVDEFTYVFFVRVCVCKCVFPGLCVRWVKQRKASTLGMFRSVSG